MYINGIHFENRTQLKLTLDRIISEKSQFYDAVFDRTRKPFFKFFFNFLKNNQIQFKNTFNQTKIRISQNFTFKNNNNIISRQFENILYFEIFKCLVLGLVRFGSVWFGLVRFGFGFGLCRKIEVNNT
jgi:hypothetical protein